MRGESITRAVRRLTYLLLAVVGLQTAGAAVINVGSKRFTESYIVAEIVAQTLRAADEAHVALHPGLGNTAVVFAALESGSLDIYPDYSGTVALELLGLPRVPSLAEINRRLAPRGITAGVPLGFSNSYALAMPADRAQALGIVRISDLRGHPGLRYCLSQEFLQRKDGWAGLAKRYGLTHAAPVGLDHGLAYEALRSRQCDVIDAYSTDPKIESEGLRVLADDRGYFPSYEALLLYRSDFPRRFPRSWQAIEALQGRFSDAAMRKLNAEVELHGRTFDQAAADFLSGGEAGHAARRSTWGRIVDAIFAADFWRLSREHLLLVFASLAFGVLVGMPLGWCAYRVRRARYWILGATGVLQTVPALALLAFLIVLLGRIGTVPALIALGLYALLPIVRNTQIGFDGVPAGLKDSARALGLDGFARLRLIELPLAAPAIVAGIRTAAVINVGTATIAAFVGAGGYGERIVAGLAVHDTALLLAGAVPAAALAILIEALFHIAERAGAFGRRNGRSAPAP